MPGILPNCNYLCHQKLLFHVVKKRIHSDVVPSVRHWMMYCVKLYRHIYVYIRLMLCGCYAPNDTAVLIWKECCVAATHTMILPVRKIHGHSITWKTTWCEKYEVRKVELSVTVVILTKLILSDTKTFILICTFTVLISKK